MSLEEIRKQIRDHTLADETKVVQQLVSMAGLSIEERQTIAEAGADLVRRVRENSDPTLMENFLGEFGLSTDEGIALMCLAEALLRIPDAETVDALIADKISSSDWDAHLGQASSSLVNASTWALMLTGKVLSSEDDRGIVSTLHNLVRRMGEPVIRTAVAQAMKELGRQFVLGENIDDAMSRGQNMQDKGYTYSFDMLGEAAINEDDAKRYHLAYADAITEIAKQAKGDIRENPGISVKLSALHARYETIQKSHMFELLVSRIKSLAILASASNLGLNIDAEEADRLDISLDIIEEVIRDPAFEGWDGFGIVVQAYSKRAAPVLDWLYDLAKSTNRKIMVRLVKGAYWDTEIKQAQVMGLEGYPVFTRKENTDVSYIACARKLMAMRDHIYPQFATHNAHTVAAIKYLAGNEHDNYEFQRLHGMGEALLEETMNSGDHRCRIYAPVGAHKDLLAYLVRRLLENGANSSFVYQIVDETISASKIAADPFSGIKSPAHNEHIANPEHLFGRDRRNSRGFDINDPVDIARIEEMRGPFKDHIWEATPLLAIDATGMEQRAVFNPAQHEEQVGTISDTNPEDIPAAIEAAQLAQKEWALLPASKRAEHLIKTAELYEAHSGELFALLAREAGKTILDCVGEVREAVDFLRFYANEAIRLESEGKPRGIFTCISPWNFPLAIFTGQISAALGAGNAVLAKPAEQSPLIATRAVQLMHEAGIPKGVIQLLPGAGSIVGQALTSNPEISGICFTGSTQTAQIINRTMAGNLAADTPFIAETGGINAMIVDSSALPQQAITDVLASAFQSAGQRCSACRLLYLQSDIADEFMEMLHGAMAELKVGNPWQMDTDIGPLIDKTAFEQIGTYALGQKPDDQNDYLLPPTVKRVPGITSIEREIFGPVLHVATFESHELDQVVDDINAKGYGLTFGLHTRIDNRVEQITNRIECGNLYINRNQIGAIVGSQPFGGEGLSGTGPKAGGPNYMARFKRTEDNPIEKPVNNEGTAIHAGEIKQAIARFSYKEFLEAEELKNILVTIAPEHKLFDPGHQEKLPGPTGESNVLSYAPKGIVLCLGPDQEQLFAQAVAALSSGCRVITISAQGDTHLDQLEQSGAPIINLKGHAQIDDWNELGNLSAIALELSDQSKSLRQQLAQREGAITPIISQPFYPNSFMHERHCCIDTTAAGGNAALMVEAAE